MNEKLNRLVNEVQKRQTYKDGDGHQAILDICYDEWNRPENKDWSYADMVSYAKIMFGPFAEMMILLGKYNHQVCNGGHDQYFTNGYADTNGGGCFADHSHDVPLHKRTMKLMQKFGLDKTKLGKEVYDIQSKFVRLTRVAWERERADEDRYDEPVYDEIDTRYFKINEEWEVFLRNYANDVLAGRIDLDKEENNATA